jgi:hypothetical protein
LSWSHGPTIIKCASTFPNFILFFLHKQANPTKRGLAAFAFTMLASLLMLKRYIAVGTSSITRCKYGLANSFLLKIKFFILRRVV